MLAQWLPIELLALVTDPIAIFFIHSGKRIVLIVGIRRTLA